MNSLLHAAEANAVVVALLCQTLIATLMAFFSLWFNFLLDDHPIGQTYLKWLQTIPVNFAKPLGECVYCSAAWQYLFVSFFFFNSNIILCFLSLGVNYAVLKIALKHLFTSQDEKDPS